MQNWGYRITILQNQGYGIVICFFISARQLSVPPPSIRWFAGTFPRNSKRWPYRCPFKDCVTWTSVNTPGLVRRRSRGCAAHSGQEACFPLHQSTEVGRGCSLPYKYRNVCYILFLDAVSLSQFLHDTVVRH